ncbi:20S proteasome subunit alpha 1 [Pancytospora epiphaga]|nr:20S proteasome subunit alpha 1 [Pancytospora epiphaga]
MGIREQAYVVFNKEGKLLQVEYGLEAVYNSYQIVTIITGDAIVCLSKKLPIPKLSAETHTSIYKITDSIYMNITGRAPDVAYTVERARTLASSLEYSLGCELTPDIFARALSEKFQVLMQHSGKRAPAFAAAIFGFECGKPSLYYTDISAVEYPVYAMATGKDYNKMSKYLDKNMIFTPSSLNEIIELAIAVLLESIGRDAEATEIEAAVLCKDRGLIRLKESEVERRLQAVTERQ